MLVINPFSRFAKILLLNFPELTLCLFSFWRSSSVRHNLLWSVTLRFICVISPLDLLFKFTWHVNRSANLMCWDVRRFSGSSSFSLIPFTMRYPLWCFPVMFTLHGSTLNKMTLLCWSAKFPGSARVELYLSILPGSTMCWIILPVVVFTPPGSTSDWIASSVRRSGVGGTCRLEVIVNTMFICNRVSSTDHLFQHKSS